ncbi:MAG: hypothetical protein KDA71_16755 [Planctomycetales bacterium]|nr:hypothetical protein [Planctomycetales bacterium]
MWRFSGWRYLGAIVGLWLTIAAVARAAGDSDSAFLAGLRQRQLFSLAEAFCRERLADADLPPASRADLTVELIRTQSERAAHAPAAERADMWQQADTTAADFQRLHRDNPRGELVQVQAALSALARGELARQEAEVAPNPTAALEQARDALREAASRLEQLDRQLSDEIPRRNRLRPEPGRLSTDELIALQNSVQLQRARALRNQGLSYPASSTDRIASLTAALDQLVEPQRRVAPADPLDWQIRLEQIESQRLLGNIRDAATVLNKLMADKPPADVEQRAIAETARVYLAARQPDRAFEALGKVDRQRTAAADVDLALLEAHLAKWTAANSANDEKSADEWRKKSLALVDYVQQTHGAYWGRRAELLLIQVAGHTGGDGDVEVLRRTADNLYLKGQMDEALAAYDQASGLARQQGDEAAAFDLAYKAAMLQQQRQNLADSRERLQRLSTDMAQHSAAAKAHLLAAWMAAQLVRARQLELNEYLADLETQRRLWPADATTDQARLWQAAVLEQQQAWHAAASIYEEVPPQSAQFADALTAAARNVRRLLAEPAASDSQSPIAGHLSYLETIAGSDAASVELRRQAALTAAEVALQLPTGGYARAERALTMAFGDKLDGVDEQTVAARSLMLLALAGQPARRSAAQALLDELRGSSPAQLLAVVQGLAQTADAANDRLAGELAEMQLQVIDSLGESRRSLSAADQDRLLHLQAAAFARAGRTVDAIKLYEQLVEAHPDDGEVRERFAALLLDSADAKLLERALEQWRIVAARSRPDTDRWWSAKYHVALAQFKTGDKSGAAKLIRYLQATKGLGDAASAARFANLLKRCE